MSGVHYQYIPDLDETRIFDVATNGVETLREIRDGHGRAGKVKAPGPAAGKNQSDVAAARPRPAKG